MPTIVQALSAVMAEVGAVGKNDRNPQQGFNFRGIDAVVNAVSPALIRAGVVVVPDVEDVVHGTVEVGIGDKRREIGHVTVRVRYTFHGPDGDSLSCSVVAESMDSGDKATPKAMSVAFRTALLQALCLPTDDPEPDAQTYERVGRQRVTPPRQDRPADAVQSPADGVRGEIRRKAEELGLSLNEVAQRFRAQHGQDIREASDVGLLELFRDDLTPQAVAS